MRRNPSRSDRDALIIEFLPLAKACARRAYRRSGAIPFDDLVSYAHLGLIKAAAAFDPARGCGFPGYAWRQMSRAILDGVRSEARHAGAIPIDAAFEESHGDTRRTPRELDDSIDRRALAAMLGSELDPRALRMVARCFAGEASLRENGSAEGLGPDRAGVIVRGAVVAMRRRAERDGLPLAA